MTNYNERLDEVLDSYAGYYNYTAGSIDDGRFIQAAIDNGIRMKAEELIEKHKAQLEKELMNAMAQVVADVSLHVASELNFQDTGKTIRFEIRKNFKGKEANQ